jgi:DNA-binding transcriptional LysR family regulator
MSPEPGPPLDLRRLRYFVAVAEELHFGRAAQRLYIAQPVLSRQIRKLEQELGTDLLVRSSRDVALPPAGLQLLDEARSLLAAADATRRRMEDIARGQAVLTVGFFIGDELTSALQAFTATHPEISIADLADDPVIIQRGATPGWQAFHNVDPRPDGRHPRPGPAVDNLEEKLQHVAASRAVSFVPASVAAAFAQPGVAYVPVTDIPPIRICLAWRSGRSSSLVAAFVDAVTSARRDAVLQPRFDASRWRPPPSHRRGNAGR